VQNYNTSSSPQDVGNEKKKGGRVCALGEKKGLALSNRKKGKQRLRMKKKTGASEQPGSPSSVAGAFQEEWASGQKDSPTS